MALKPIFFLLLFSPISSLSIAAQKLALPNDITSFIPSCASDCFQSFVDVYFNPSDCSATPNKECLCSRTGSSGYTLGEGAAQCILAGNQLGYCAGLDLNSKIVQNAYGVCSNQPNAARNTHSTLVATLVVPNGASGPIVVATPTSTSSTRSTRLTSRASSASSASSASFATRTSSTRSTSSTRPTRSTTLPRATTSGVNNGNPPNTHSPRITLPLSSPTNTASANGTAAADGQGTSADTLSTPQVVGISLGVTSAIGLAVAAILLARAVRRSRYSDDPDDLQPMREHSWNNYGRKGGSGSANISAHVTPDPSQILVYHPALQSHPTPTFFPGPVARADNTPTPPRKLQVHQATPTSPGSTSNENRPDTIGLAISPEMAATQSSSSTQPSTLVLGPPRPALTLAIPPPKRTQAGARGAGAAGRDSIVTEFAEDGDDASPDAQFWAPPSADPKSSTSALYVQDRWGNWRLSQNPAIPIHVSEAAELEGDSPLTLSATEKAKTRVSLSPTSASTPLSAALGSASSSTPLTAAAAPIGLAPPNAVRQGASNRTSSIYSQQTLPEVVIPDANNPMPTSSTSDRTGQEKVAARVLVPPARAPSRNPNQIVERTKSMPRTVGNPKVGFAPPTRRPSHPTERQLERSNSTTRGMMDPRAVPISLARKPSRNTDQRVDRSNSTSRTNLELRGTPAPPPSRPSQKTDRRTERNVGVSRTLTDPRARVKRSNTVSSLDSATTIESCDEDEDGDENDRALGTERGLSPVVESPQSPGRSPVTYPKIKPQPGKPLFPPPVKRGEPLPPSQPSPTLGNALPVRISQGPDAFANLSPVKPPVPLKVPKQPLNTRPEEEYVGPYVRKDIRPSRSSSRGAPTIRFIDETGNTTAQPSKNAQNIARKRTAPEGGEDRGSMPYRLNVVPARRNPNPNRNPGDVRTGSPETRGGSFENAPREHVAADDTSPPKERKAEPAAAPGIAAKRLGLKRAQSLALNRSTTNRRPVEGKWRREDPPPPAPPAIYVDGVQLPATPGWTPTLTPTKRGDDLYLNVR